MPYHTPVRSLFLAILLCLACLACLGGCGQKGPLYLPDEQGQEKR
jgi:predicted small lipoprotein YifL